MKIYETIFILKPQLDEEQIQKNVDSIEQLIKNAQGEILKVDNWGLKNLAYDIKKNNQGYYIQIHFKTDESLIKKLESNYKLNEDVIRYITVKLKPSEIKPYTETNENTENQS